MEDSQTTVPARKKWTDRAVEYAEEFGWRIVPLEANVGESSPSSSENPVERQLGCFIFPEQPTSNPEEIEALGTMYPTALIGAATGEKSNLVAVEADRKSELLAQVEGLAPNAPRILGANFEYFLFQYPKRKSSLPTLETHEEGAFHGEDSVIRLPWQYLRWGLLPAEERLAPVSEDILSLFGLSEGKDAPEEAGPDSQSAEGGQAQSDSSGHPQLSLSLQSSPNGAAERGHAPDFRSGADLRFSPENETALSELPWTLVGGLSVLTGPSKTAGKSTWATNLAAHAVSGKPFLEYETEPCDVVLLADTSPTGFKRQLQRIGILSNEDLERLHVLHPCDVQDLDWGSTVNRAYSHAAGVDAELIIIDCLDRYVRLKHGGAPNSEDVVHALTAEAPRDCAVLALTCTETTPEEAISTTIERLGLLARAADVVLRMDNLSTTQYPGLRRIGAVSRMGSTPSNTFCTLRKGRYVRVRQPDVRRAEQERASGKNHSPSLRISNSSEQNSGNALLSN